MDVAVEPVPGGGVGDRHRNILCPAHPVLREMRRDPRGALAVGRVEAPPPIHAARLGVHRQLLRMDGVRLSAPGLGLGIRTARERELGEHAHVLGPTRALDEIDERGLRGGGVALSPMDLGDVLLNQPVAIEGGVCDVMVGESVVQPPPVEVQQAALEVGAAAAAWAGRCRGQTVTP